MKAAMILILSVMLGLTMTSVRAAEGHDHGQAASAKKSSKVESLGGGKKCDKCNKNKGSSMGGGMDGDMGKCCCAGMKEKMGMSHDEHHGGMNHDAMMERMQKMEARMAMMEKMTVQAAKPPPHPDRLLTCQRYGQTIALSARRLRAESA